MLRLALVSAIILGASPALAQDEAGQEEEAQALFDAARMAYEAGRYDDALERFQEAYEQSGHPELLYNIGMSADRLRHDDEALEAFEAYLSAVPDAENRVSVQNRIEALRQAIAERDAVPTPAETAAAADTGADSAPIWSKWWFWTALAALVVGGVVLGIVLASGDTQQAPIEGDYGVVVMTLGSE